MKRMDAPQIIALYNRSEALQQPMWTLWDELARYIQPSKSGIVAPRIDGEKRTEDLFDSTAPQANDDLAHYLSASLSPSGSPWLMNEFRDKGLRKDDTYTEWLQECTEIQRAEFLRSNFYETVGEVYADLPCFGIGTLQCDERKTWKGAFDGINWESVWIREITALANQYGDLDTTFRGYEMSALQWFQMFGKDAGPQVTELAQSKPEQKIKFIHAVYPRDPDDIDAKGVERGLVDPKKMAIASVWVNLTDKVITRESGYMELPRHITRWAKTSGSIWANSPGLMALPDIRTLNEATRLEMIAWEKSIDRPMKVNQNNLVGDKLDQSARGLTICRDIAALAPLFDATDFNLTAVKTDELRASILRTFYADLIREPGNIEGAQTAYEVAKRIERAQRILGEAVPHLRGMLKWAAERSFKILYRAGQFPKPPAGLMEASPQIDVRYTSPLQAAQESQGIEQTIIYLGELQGLSKMQVEVGLEPTILDWVDWDGIAVEAARRRSVPATGLRSQIEVDDIRAERDAKREKAESQQDALQGAEVVRGVGAGAGKEAGAAVLRSMRG